MAQPIRYLLAYQGVDYEDKQYDCEGKEWSENDKLKLGLEFPNLPYYIDGKLKLTQSMVILEYLAQKHNLAGSTEEEKLRIKIAAHEAVDLRLHYASTVYSPKDIFESKKESLAKTLPNKFKLWSDNMGTNKFATGNNVTYVDFILYEILYQISILLPGCLDNFKNLADYVKRFESLPAIVKYRTSPKFVDKPFNFTPMAPWNP